jgi:hypothetical protein
MEGLKALHADGNLILEPPFSGPSAKRLNMADEVLLLCSDRMNFVLTNSKKKENVGENKMGENRKSGLGNGLAFLQVPFYFKLDSPRGMGVVYAKIQIFMQKFQGQCLLAHNEGDIREVEVCV